MKRFWDKVKKTKDCWFWIGASRGQGYGSFKYLGKVESPHRMAWFLTHGYFSQLNVLHKCDNRKCVNPKHLFLGTQSDNMKDCAAKGRIFKPFKSITHSNAGYQRGCRCSVCRSVHAKINAKYK